jgi:hypothetical protein
MTFESNQQTTMTNNRYRLVTRSGHYVGVIERDHTGQCVLRPNMDAVQAFTEEVLRELHSILSSLNSKPVIELETERSSVSVFAAQ